MDCVPQPCCRQTSAKPAGMVDGSRGWYTPTTDDVPAALMRIRAAVEATILSERRRRARSAGRETRTPSRGTRMRTFTENRLGNLADDGRDLPAATTYARDVPCKDAIYDEPTHPGKQYCVAECAQATNWWLSMYRQYSFDPPNFRWYSVLLANQARETVRK